MVDLVEQVRFKANYYGGKGGIARGKGMIGLSNNVGSFSEAKQTKVRRDLIILFRFSLRN